MAEGQDLKVIHRQEFTLKIYDSFFKCKMMCDIWRCYILEQTGAQNIQTKSKPSLHREIFTQIFYFPTLRGRK